MAREIFPLYLEHLDAALENFYEGHWPCEYVEQSSGLRCVNVKSGHGGKGHQNKSGKIFADGSYVSQRTFEELRQEFASNCFFRLQELLERLDALRQKRGPRNDEVQAAAEIHRDDVMAWFYRHVSLDGRAAQYNSHSVCLCCLLRPPEHPLPCGHVLCTHCISVYGHSRPGSRTEIEIEYCPLEVQSVRTFHPWRVHLKPDAAGVRILTLDGGGIRGIIELVYLQTLEQALNRRNGRLRVQSFFDLVIGTSTGGLIALGMVARHWPIATCIANFKELCQQAFTRRAMGNLPLIGFFVDNYNHSKYETKPLKNALRTAFSEDQYLFGGQRYDQTWNSPVKVAVTATLSSTSPVLLANYNRTCDDKLGYQFHRAESVETELKTWEAARATSAAPRYFKPFHHEESSQTFLDGALYHNNPIGVADSEWKLIWPSNLSSHPDIILSLGTGFDPQKRQPQQRNAAMRPGIVRNGKFLLKIAADHIEDALDCEKTWDEYVRRIPHDSRSRFVRYSPKLVKCLPALDDVYLVESLQDLASKHLSEEKEAAGIQKLAMQLIATSFYFETEKVLQASTNAATITGRIHCRFADDSLEIQELGMLIRERTGHDDRNPLFSIRECGSSRPLIHHEVNSDVIYAMTRGKFVIPTLTVQLHNKLSETEICFSLKPGHAHPISAFPRCLVDDDKGKTRILHPTTVNARRWAGRSSSRKYHQSLWQPPDRAASNIGRTIADYHNSDHVMGFATAEQIRRSASQFSQAPFEIDSRELPNPRVHAIELPAESRPTELHASGDLSQKSPVARRGSDTSQGAVADDVHSGTGSGYHVPSCPVCNIRLYSMTEREVSLHVNACLDGDNSAPSTEANSEHGDADGAVDAGTPGVQQYLPYRPAPPASPLSHDAAQSPSTSQTPSTQSASVSNIDLLQPSSTERIAMYNSRRDMWANHSQSRSSWESLPLPTESEQRPQSTKERNTAQFDRNGGLSFSASNAPDKDDETQDEGYISRSSTVWSNAPRGCEQASSGASAYRQMSQVSTRPRSEEYDEWHDTTEWFTGAARYG
jgi:predicted acylesterase/phospholipase RssA